MLTPDLLHPYQKKAVNFQCSRPHSMLWLDMGLGKTVITLSSIAHLINSRHLRAVLIVAPIRVIRLVWRQEAVKWKHTEHLTFSMLTGTKDQRVRALLKPANVYMINYENLGWLAETLQTYFLSKGREVPFNGVVWDEISKCKNSATNRVKAVKKILDAFDWVTGLTGTPASNGYKDLHGQYLVVDKGQRLGTSKTAFRTRFYKKVGPYKEVAYEDTEDTIKKLIGDITLEMSAEDYNPLPDLMVNNVEIDMPPDVRDKYEKLEKEFFLTLDSGKEIEAFNQASLTNKCLQFSNGAIYPVAGMPLWEPIHDLKLDALEEIIDEAQGSPILCAYAYRSDAERIMTRFKDLDPINLTECKTEYELVGAMHRWKTGDCRLMIGHPACLHPQTEVLTERRGWVKIIDVKPDDRVFDGIEFVTHSGCSYSGYKDVIDVFGITMTPDHKLLVGDEWMEGKHVRDIGNAKSKALFKWENTPRCESDVSDLRCGATDDSTKRNQKQSGTTSTLQSLHYDNVSPIDRYTNLENMAWLKTASQRPKRQKLRWSRDNCLSGVEQFFQVLSGYVGRVFGRFDNRANRRKQTVSKRQLPLGNEHGTTSQQAQQSSGDLQGRANAPSRVCSTGGILKNDVDHANESGHVCGGSGGRLHHVELREKSKSCECSSQTKAHVYDLVDCGPRHRFLIRNDDGEMFISHNSMGHGIDGLQKNGHILVWYGLNWSLDLYEQFNARVRRQGQGVPVMCHRIMCRDTLDQAQALALDDKASTQAGLRKAIKEYRLQKQI